MLCKPPEGAATDTGSNGAIAAGTSSSACTFNTGETEKRRLLKGDIVLITDSSDRIPTNVKSGANNEKTKRLQLSAYWKNKRERYDDVDNHYGIFVFVDANDNILEVNGDFCGADSTKELETALAHLT